MLPSTAESLCISEEDLGKRIDKFLVERFPNHSRTYFQFLIENDSVLVNGKSIKKHYRPELHDEIEICFLLTPELDVKPEPIPLDILFEDEHFIAINKPSNMVVHPAPGAYSGTFANALLYHCKQLNPTQFEHLRPGIVHRLDKDTTGVLLGAKTIEAHQKLIQQFAQRNIIKNYLTLCVGTPPEGKFSAPLKRHPVKRKEMTVCSEGKEAISHFRLIAKKNEFSLVEVQLITGRTHQIRAHLKHLHCPILGDETYGNSSLNQKYQLHRQLLHAHQIKMVHPILGTPLEITAPMPSDMKNFIELIQLA